MVKIHQPKKKKKTKTNFSTNVSDAANIITVAFVTYRRLYISKTLRMDLHMQFINTLTPSTNNLTINPFSDLVRT